MSAGDLAPAGAVSSGPPAPSAVSRQSSPVRGEEERGGEGREGERKGWREEEREEEKGEREWSLKSGIKVF